MKNIAIIGFGVSGLTVAYLLLKNQHVTVFDKNVRVHGHTPAVDIEKYAEHFTIDTSFIVFNDKTYPSFLALLTEIGITKQATEMSISMHNCQTGME
jgi:predicted NAD/FAD-binding protein